MVVTRNRSSKQLVLDFLWSMCGTEDPTKTSHRWPVSKWYEVFVTQHSISVVSDFAAVPNLRSFTLHMNNIYWEHHVSGFERFTVMENGIKTVFFELKVDVFDKYELTSFL